MNSKLRLLTGISLFLALGVATGCPGDDGTAEGTGTGSTSEAESSTGLGMTSTPTPTTMTTEPADTGSDTSSGPSTITASEGSSSDGPACPMEGELGDPCAEPCDCASNNCFVVGPLGGVCSECDASEDCQPDPGFGCNFGNPLAGMPAVCSTTGDIGESCETADDCAAGLFCPTLIEVAGIISASTCSACDPETNDGCMGGDICTPLYDIANIGGNYYCAPVGTVADNEGCNLTGDGMECVSGQCAPAGLMGIPVVAVCSPCNEDDDCGAGETCAFPEIVIEGTSLALVPGMCV